MRYKSMTIDVLFGITVPALCLIGDPLVFPDHESAMDGPVWLSWVLDRYRVLFYGWILSCMAAFLYVHLHRGRGRLHCFLAGTLVAGAVLAGFFGLMLLPLSLPSLVNIRPSIAGTVVVAVVAVGFLPFLTAFVYYRQARPLLDAARARRGTGRLVVLGAVAPIALAGVAQVLAGAGAFAVAG